MKHFRLLAALLIILIAGCSEDGVVDNKEDIDDNPVVISEHIRQVVETVNIDSLKFTLEILTGIKPFINNSDTVLITSRFSDYAGNDHAADYLEYRLNNYGYDVVNQNFNAKGRNVYAIRSGNVYPDEYYIICAHYDSLPESVIAPGADDNGSGTAAVIEAARIFSNLNPKYSIIFALWDEEEQGLIGSKYFAEQTKNINMNIKGVINIDMIGWDSNNDHYLRLSVPNPDIDYPVAIKAKEINTGMSLGLQILIVGSTISSDHASFLSKGYQAYCFIEDNMDFNGFYHSTNDQMQFFNFTYYYKNCKMIIGTLASLTI